LKKPKNENAQAKELLVMRKHLLNQCATMSHAFEIFIRASSKFVPEGSTAVQSSMSSVYLEGSEEAASSEYGRGLSPKDFYRFLKNQFPSLPREMYESVFEFLDDDKNGYVSFKEFHNAIESVAPVHTVEDLRRRWISLGNRSLRRVVMSMRETSMLSPNGFHELSRRLRFHEFAAALSKVCVTEDEEHQALFAAIRDTQDTSWTVSLEQLMSALAAVSPHLVLEDTRDVLLKKYGTLEKAYAALDYSCNSEYGGIGRKGFIRSAQLTWKFTHPEACKAFELIDSDKNGTLSRQEILTALRLSEPALWLEDVRRKVRQRFKTLNKAITEGSCPSLARPQSEGGPTGRSATKSAVVDTQPTTVDQSSSKKATSNGAQPMSSQQLAAMLSASSGPAHDLILEDSELHLLYDLIDVNADRWKRPSGLYRLRSVALSSRRGRCGRCCMTCVFHRTYTPRPS
jgi:Ca2+-binding EF-hand superfamily protein